MWVAGADGCPVGWVVVFRSLADELPRVRIIKRLEDAFAAPEHPKLIAVDIPIGLPAVSRRGGRIADREARTVLGRERQSSVFPTPSRATLAATSFAEACAIEQKNSEPAKKVSQQIFHILHKINEIDLLARQREGSLFECHPEVSFWAMNNAAAMRLPKKVSKRKNPTGLSQSGLDERRALLARHGYEPEFLATRAGSAAECGTDDFLDACVAAWTAERIFKGKAVRLPATPDKDALGLDMAIWA